LVTSLFEIIRLYVTPKKTVCRILCTQATRATFFLPHSRATSLMHRASLDVPEVEFDRLLTKAWCKTCQSIEGGNFTAAE
jgi:hypothetical protein